MFEMYWDDVCTLFEGIYINWDPKLLRNRLEFHGCVSLCDICVKMRWPMRFILCRKWKTHNEEDKVICESSVFCG